MMLNCVRCKRKTPELNPTPMLTKNDRLMRSTCPVWNQLIQIYVKERNRGSWMGRIISHIPLIGPLLKGIFGSEAGKACVYL